MRNKKSPKPSAGKKKDGFSIANLISIVGLIALAFFLYFGFAYSGINSSTSVLYAVLITLGMGLLLYALLYAKSVENNFEKWRIVEYTLLVVYIGASVAIIPTLCHFINVNSESTTLKNYAIQDLNGMEKALDDFKKYEKSNLNQLVTRLQTVSSAYNYNSVTTGELKEYIDEVILNADDKVHSEKLNEEIIASFEEKWNKNIDNIHGEDGDYASEFENAIKKNFNRIQVWNVFEIPQAIEDIYNLSIELGGKLNSISESYPLHKIDMNGSQYDVVSKHTAFTTSLTSTFKEECAKKAGLNFFGIVLSVVIFLLIIFNYVVAYRSTKVSVKAGGSTHDGGMIIKP